MIFTFKDYKLRYFRLKKDTYSIFAGTVFVVEIDHTVYILSNYVIKQDKFNVDDLLNEEWFEEVFVQFFTSKESISKILRPK